MNNIINISKSYYYDRKIIYYEWSIMIIEMCKIWNVLTPKPANFSCY